MNQASLYATLKNPLRPFLKKAVVRRWLKKVLGRRYLHFLHIGKTGGSAIKYVLAGRPLVGPYVVLLHEHDVTLPKIPEGEPFFFVVRDPIRRFVSGFYSRQRQGRPRIYSPWTSGEVVAFQQFSTANELAEALSATEPGVRAAAENAMQSIRHVNMHYNYWFQSDAYFRSRAADLFFVGYQESLDECFSQLMTKLGVARNLKLPSDSVVAHRNPGSADQKLSATATENLRNWYRDDYAFLTTCRELSRSVNQANAKSKEH